MVGQRYSDEMMPEATPFAAVLRGGLLVVLALATACSTTTPLRTDAPAAVDPQVESEALQAAQTALREGDCRTASESYLRAARSSDDPEVAMRASQLAMGCENLTSARLAAARWRELVPYSGEAALAAALVAMKRYDVDEAREALAAWRDSGHSGTQDPLSFAEVLADEADAALVYRLFGEVLMGDDPAAEVLLAQARLALSAYNMQAALDAARRAGELDPNMIEAQAITLRALSMLGQHDAALAGAAALPAEELRGEDAFLLADLLQGAGRNADAEQELEILVERPETAAGAARRLISLAHGQGRLDAAEQRLEELFSRTGVTPLGVLYYAQLAERRGDTERAIESYRVLGDSAMGLSARASAARLLMKEGATAEALQLIDEHGEQNIRDALEAGLTRAHLQSVSGDLKGALATLDELAKRFPDHPDIDYSRATVLESAGRTRQAVAEFERALKRRPEDPQLLNALGYTLADHGMRLRDAESYVRKALTVSPDNPAIQDSLGWVLYRGGRQQQALDYLERAWLNSQDAEIGAHFGEVLWKSGAEDRAYYVWQQALAGSPDHEGVRATIKRLTGEDVGGG
jgi:tetratricopeptide (TPR) repeat protein